MERPSIVLASASPRRLALLEGLGCAVEVRPSGLPETPQEGESPERLVARLARDKGLGVAAALKAPSPSPVLAADTAVVLDDRVLGKPADREEAGRMLRRLAGRTHEVLTGVYLTVGAAGREASVVERTRVRFRDWDPRLVEWYVRGGEPLDKAGAYGLQGRGVLLAERIEGSWSNVVGLPLERLPELFETVGLDLLEFVD